jgi:RNA polymerase sigma-70 factor (ECF subfamily)
MFVKKKHSLPDQAGNTLGIDKQIELGQGLLENDEIFIKKAFESNPENGYELLFKRYYRPLCSHVARITLSQEVAEDLVGDVFFSFWQFKSYLKVRTSLRAYLFVAARNRAISYLRSGYHKSINIDIYDHEPEDKKAVPDQMLQYTELYLKIDRLIKEVSPQSQKVFIMSRFEGKNNQVIAQELQIAEKTVEGHITRVLNMLRKALKEDFFLSLICIIATTILLIDNNSLLFLNLTRL